MTNFESRYVDGQYLEDHPDWHQADSPWKALQIMTMLRLTDQRPRTVCEVGCGAGAILTHLIEKIPHITCLGLDISPQAIEIAQKRENEFLHFQLIDATIYKCNQFDLVLVIDVLEHVPDYLGFLKAIRQLGHSFIFHIPLELSALWVLREWQIDRRRKLVGHLHHFTKNIALDSLTICGYEIERFFFTDSGFQPPDNSIKATIRDTPQRMLFALFPDLTVRFFGGYSLLVKARPTSS
jgi:SAM-dependent methyltransferase